MSKNILLVDDDADIRTFVVTVIKENGFTPLMAKNGEEGIEKVKSGNPDLIILDVLMPKQSGIKMYRELKTNGSFKDIPVIILSGISKRVFLHSQEALTEFGGKNVPEPEAYIEKPVEPEELAEIIKKYVK
ncbi:MAG: hypothetical protein A2176_13240 [Spirochaetes bacterium RBG_13_51_14]|nr:MAG: hypothetical protein A2176_13240 [Spirochaetes bacterium RBG_13_51_14]